MKFNELKYLLLEFTESTIKKLVIKFSNEASEQEIRYYLNKFEEVKSKLKNKDPFSYTSFRELENAVDAASVSKKDKIKVSNRSFDNLKIYEDEEILVYKANNAVDCILLGMDEYYTFCISRKSGNLYSGYRLRHGSTFYFIRFKNKTSEKTDDGKFVDPSHYIVIDMQDNGRIEYTWADNGNQRHGTEEVSMDKIIRQFPELEKVFNLGIFKNEPLTENEKEKLRKFNTTSNTADSYTKFKETFNKLSFQEKIEYIRAGFEINSSVIVEENEPKIIKLVIRPGHIIKYGDLNTLSKPMLQYYLNVLEKEIDSMNLQEVSYYKIVNVIIIRDILKMPIDKELLNIFLEGIKYFSQIEEYFKNGGYLPDAFYSKKHNILEVKLAFKAYNFLYTYNISDNNNDKDKLKNMIKYYIINKGNERDIVEYGSKLYKNILLKTNESLEWLVDLIVNNSKLLIATFMVLISQPRNEIVYSWEFDEYFFNVGDDSVARENNLYVDDKILDPFLKMFENDKEEYIDIIKNLLKKELYKDEKQKEKLEKLLQNVNPNKVTFENYFKNYIISNKI